MIDNASIHFLECIFHSIFESLLLLAGKADIYLKVMHDGAITGKKEYWHGACLNFWRRHGGRKLCLEDTAYKRLVFTSA